MSEGHAIVKRIFRNVPITKDVYNLHRVDTSQLQCGSVTHWADQIEILRCPNANDEACHHPACGCHCMPIKESAFPIQFAGPEPMTQAEHAEQLDATRPTRTPADFRKLALCGIGLAIAWICVGVFVAWAWPQVFRSVFTG